MNDGSRRKLESESRIGRAAAGTMTQAQIERQAKKLRGKPTLAQGLIDELRHARREEDAARHPKPTDFGAPFGGTRDYLGQRALDAANKLRKMGMTPDTRKRSRPKLRDAVGGY